MFLFYQVVSKILFHKVRYILFCSLLVVLLFFNIGTRLVSLTYQSSLETMPENQELINIISTYDFLSEILFFLIILVILYVAIISVLMNKREIGIMLSMGMGNVKIFVSFFYEVIILYLFILGAATITIYTFSEKAFFYIDPDLYFYKDQFKNILYSSLYSVGLLSKTIISMICISLFSTFFILISILFVSPLKMINKRNF